MHDSAPTSACSSALCRALFSSDQSFPLAGGFAYSVFQFQSKRIKQNPDGPFLAGNPMVGALVSTVANLGVSCLVSAMLLPHAHVMQDRWPVRASASAPTHHHHPPIPS